MDTNETNAASENQGHAATCATSPGAGCWPLPSEWDVPIPPQAVVIEQCEIQPGIKCTRPKWNKNWLRGLESFVRSIVRDEISKANTFIEREKQV